MNRRKKVRRKAKDRYQMDYKGILLNTLVSATSSLTAASLLNFVKSVPPSEMPLIVGIIFVAQIIPKLLVEVNKRYQINKAKREGFSDGALTDDFDNNKSTTLEILLDLCEHASYY